MCNCGVSDSFKSFLYHDKYKITVLHNTNICDIKLNVKNAKVYSVYYNPHNNVTVVVHTGIIPRKILGRYPHAILCNVNCRLPRSYGKYKLLKDGSPILISSLYTASYKKLAIARATLGALGAIGLLLVVTLIGLIYISVTLALIGKN